MKKILIISAGLYIGGAEKVARDIALYSEHDKYEYHYVVFGNGVGAYEPQLTSIGAKIIRFSPPSTSYINYYRALIRIMRENHYQVIHVHTMFNAGWAMLAAKQCGVPVRVSHAHSSLQGVKSTIISKIYEIVMRKLIIKYATDYVACGVAAGNRLYGEGTFSKEGTLILNGVDTNVYRFNISSREKIRKELDWTDCFVIGHVGHLSAEKNQGFLIDLMPELIKKIPSARLLLLGEGLDRASLEQKAVKNGLTDHIHFTGNVTNVFDFLSAMDVFAFPSLYEGMPLSVIEVQANGLPCVLSTGVPKDVYLTDLVRPLSLDKPDAWVEAICNAQRNEPEKYADQLKLKGFDTETAMKKIYEIYERAD